MIRIQTERTRISASMTNPQVLPLKPGTRTASHQEVRNKRRPRNRDRDAGQGKEMDSPTAQWRDGVPSDANQRWSTRLRKHKTTNRSLRSTVSLVEPTHECEGAPHSFAIRSWTARWSCPGRKATLPETPAPHSDPHSRGSVEGYVTELRQASTAFPISAA